VRDGLSPLLVPATIVAFSMLVCAAASALALIGPGTRHIDSNTDSLVNADYGPDARAFILPPLDSGIADQAREAAAAEEVEEADGTGDVVQTGEPALPPLVLEPPRAPSSTPRGDTATPKPGGAAPTTPGSGGGVATPTPAPVTSGDGTPRPSQTASAGEDGPPPPGVVLGSSALPTLPPPSGPTASPTPTPPPDPPALPPTHVVTPTPPPHKPPLPTLPPPGPALPMPTLGPPFP